MNNVLDLTMSQCALEEFSSPVITSRGCRATYWEPAEAGEGHTDVTKIIVWDMSEEEEAALVPGATVRVKGIMDFPVNEYDECCAEYEEEVKIDAVENMGCGEYALSVNHTFELVI